MDRTTQRSFYTGIITAVMLSVAIGGILNVLFWNLDDLRWSNIAEAFVLLGLIPSIAVTLFLWPRTYKLGQWAVLIYAGINLVVAICISVNVRIHIGEDLHLIHGDFKMTLLWLFVVLSSLALIRMDCNHTKAIKTK